MSTEKRWRTWDRNPSEPVFRDYTYVNYLDTHIETFPDCLDFNLTNFLNQNNVKLSNPPTEEEIALTVEAFNEYEKKCSEISTNTRRKIEMLNNSRSERMLRLGDDMAKELQEKINGNSTTNGTLHTRLETPTE
jgi:hypothetical protein